MVKIRTVSQDEYLTNEAGIVYNKLVASADSTELHLISLGDVYRTLNDVVGKVLSTLDTMGFDRDRQQAYKSLLISQIWSSYDKFLISEGTVDYTTNLFGKVFEHSKEREYHPNEVADKRVQFNKFHWDKVDKEMKG